jgi:hypothetical protein
MYDLAKRSLAFTVATGGLLLTGTAFSPAMAAGGLGTTQGPAHAQEVRDAVNAPSAPDSATVFGGTAAKTTLPGPAVAPPELPASRGYDAGALRAEEIFRGFHIPLDLGMPLCGESAPDRSGRTASAGGECLTDDGDVATVPMTSPLHCAEAAAESAEAPGRGPAEAAEGTEGHATCATAEGSDPTLPDLTAPGSDVASATAPSAGLTRTPIDVPAGMRMTRSAAYPATGHRSAGWSEHRPMSGCSDDWQAGEEEGQGGDTCTPSPYPYGESPTCTPPPPPTCTPSQINHTVTPPPTTTPPTHISHTITPPPSTTPPASMSTAPTGTPTTPSHGGGLAHTGADIEIALSMAAAALLAGLGLRAATRRRGQH